MSKSENNTTKFLKILLHAAFFFSGIATILIGQLLSPLAGRLKLNDSQTGLFFLAQFSGSLTGTFATKWFGRRDKFALAAILGCFLMAGGVLVLNSASFVLCLTGFFINGLGIGLTLPAINLLIIELNSSNSPAALNVLNFFWGLGAILSQPFVDFFSRGESFFIPTALLAAWLILTGILLGINPSKVEKRFVESSDAETTDDAPIWTQPIAWLLALFNFIHVGFESAMGGWLKTYTQRLENATAPELFPPIFLYFLFFVVGRGVAPIFFKFLDENKVLILSLLTILLGMGVLIYADSLLILSIGTSIAGFGTSSIFPTNVSRFTHTFGANAIKKAMPLFVCGTLGSAFTTWLIGYVSNYYQNNLRLGMSVLLVSILLLLFLQIYLTFRKRKSVSEF